ncbi:uncharacterized protein LOC112590659 [Harpegnathos saltator]|uniref:uncharacterized protein LOC112590659 n=1 Tax=Harpegnathos saltator TaxID=610380 RepID=UPI000DBED49C|nr:uncharacterized protein LOC112590659 [Harpegnathos saltator]
MTTFKHDYLPLDLQIQEVLEPIYSDLSRPELLNRCKDSNTQNNNESYNGLLWHFAPKHLHRGLKTIELANFFAVAIFNEGFQAILKAFETMGVIIGPSAKDYAEKRHREASKEVRTARRTAAAAQQQFFEQEEGELYGPGIAE